MLLGLAPLLAQLVQRLRDPGGLEPPAPEVGDVLAPPLLVRLVGAEARERGSIHHELVAVAVAIAASTLVLLVLVLVLVMVVGAVVVGLLVWVWEAVVVAVEGTVCVTVVG